MNRLIALLTIVVFICLPYSTLPQGIWKTYTTDDGLACNEVFCISQDKLSNMWFGTWGGGLSKMDTNGVWTRFFGDVRTVIYDIEIDNLNNVWVALSSYKDYKDYVVNIEDSTFTYYQPQGETGPNPNVLGQDSLGQIWCGTSQLNTYWFDGADWHPFWVPGTWDIYDGVADIKTDRYGKLYFGHSNGVSTQDEFLFEVGWVTKIAFDKQNRLWFGVDDWKNGLYMFDGDSLYHWTKDNGLVSPLSEACAVAIDSNNNVWIGNGSYWGIPYGVSKFNGSTFTHFNTEHGLTDGLVYDIYVDKEGDIWFATYRGGVSVLHDTTITNVKRESRRNILNKFSLFQNYPNPFNSSTCLKYNLNASGYVELSIYNLLGKEVKTVVQKYQSLGEYEINWNGTDNSGKEVSTGIYLALLKTSNFKKLIKLSLIR